MPVRQFLDTVWGILSYFCFVLLFFYVSPFDPCYDFNAQTIEGLGLVIVAQFFDVQHMGGCPLTHHPLINVNVAVAFIDTIIAYYAI